MRPALLTGAIIAAVACHGTAFAMTAAELAEALRKARHPRAEAVSALSGAVEESTFEFLMGGTYLEATFEGSLRPEVLRFVRQRDRLIPIGSGHEGQQRLTNDVDVRVRSTGAALQYVRWLLEVTRESGLWLVESVDDVPFLPAPRDQPDRRKQIEAVRKDLEGKIRPPGAEQSGPIFVVHQDAVTAGDLVRYTVTVTKLGMPTIETTTIARDLPVVYAGPI